MKRKTRTLTLALGLALAAAACGGDENNNNNTTNNNSNNNTTNNNTNMPPPPPTLGTQIDRNGRPAITAALIAVLGEAGPQGMARDSYNAAGQSEWGTFAGEIAGNLAIYDSLDGTCGNQLLAGADPVAGRYDGLAGALADDRLYINSDSGTCGQYFGVELDATGVAPNTDCGGRTPYYDVVDVTYSAVAIGAVAGVGDGVDADDGTHSDSDFPFLAAP